MNGKEFITILTILSLLFISAGCTQRSPVESKQPLDANKEMVVTDISAPKAINQPGYYRVVSDISLPVKPGSQNRTSGISIQSSGVTLDGMGHSIDGLLQEGMKEGGIGIRCSDYLTGITIKNFSVTKCSRGIECSGSDILIRDVTVSGNMNGIYLIDGDDSRIEGVTALDNRYGIRLLRSSNITIRDNVVRNSDFAGIEFQGSEDISIRNNTLANNRMSGVEVYGYWIRQQNVDIPVINQRVYQFYSQEWATSGGGHRISRNTITGGSNGIRLWDTRDGIVSNNVVKNTQIAGISLNKVDFSGVSDNDISDAQIGILVHNSGFNNIFSNNTLQDTGAGIQVSNSPEISSLVFGTLLLIFLKFAGIVSKVIVKICISRFLPEYPRLLAGEGKYHIFGKFHRISSAVNHHTVVSVAGAVILGGAFTYASPFRPTIAILSVFILIGAVVVVLHEAMHFLTARMYRFRVTYRLWWQGIILLIVTSFTRTVFGQPILTRIEDEEHCDRRDLAMVMLSGPLVSFCLSLSFLSLYFLKGTFSSIALVGLEMSLITAVVSFLPIRPLDGKRVLDWNFIVWAAVFSPFLLLYAYFFIYRSYILIALMIAVLVAGTGYYLVFRRKG